MKNTKTGLGYYVRLILCTPFWILHVSPTKKSWNEFKSGLINHEHQFEEEPYVIELWVYDNVHVHACKHFGCNLVDPRTYPTAKGMNLNRRTYENLYAGKEYIDFEDYFNKNKRHYYHGLEEPVFHSVPKKHM